jgi:hypothetical protein
MAHDLDPVALQRVGKLLDHLDIDQRAGTPGDILKTAILEWRTTRHARVR